MDGWREGAEALKSRLEGRQKDEGEGGFFFEFLFFFSADMGALKTLMPFLLFFWSLRKLKMFERLSTGIAAIKSACARGRSDGNTWTRSVV